MEKSENKKTLYTNRLFVSAIAVLCTMLWGTAFPAIKIGYNNFRITAANIPSQLMFAGARFLLAGIIVLAAGFVISRDGSQKPLLKKGDVFPISVLSFFQTYGQYLFLYIGIVQTSGTRSSLYTSVAAFTSVLLSAVVFRSDNLNLRKICGCFIGFAGIFIMLSEKDNGGMSLWGDGLVIFSNMFGGIGNVISKKINVGRTAAQVAGWQLTLGGIALILTGLILGGSLVFYDMSCFLILVYLGTMAGTAFLLWTMLLFHNPVSRVAVYNLLIPVFGTMWSGIFLGENIFTIQNLLSLMFVCSGIFLVNVNISKLRKSK